MRVSFAVGPFVALLLSLKVGLFLEAPATAAQTIEGTVTRVVDGDDVRVKDDAGHVTRVRLAGIDAPERPQPWGEEARRALTERVLDQRVRVEVMGRDRRKRTLGVGYLGPLSINLWLVQEGHAWYYRGGKNHALPALQEQLQAAEQEARAAGWGLWREPNPEPPWEFKRRRARGGR